MKPVSPWRLLPHEIFFGLFLLATWARLVLAAGFFNSDTLLYFVLIAANAWAVWYCRSGKSPNRWRWGMLFYPVAMNAVYFNMKSAIPKIHPQQMDSALQHLDQLIIGTNLSLRLQPFIHPALTEFLSFCYFLFLPYLLLSMIWHFCGEMEVLKKFVVGLFSIYGLGFVGYSLVPAAGPYLAMSSQFTVPLTGWWITKWNAAIIAAGSNGVDVFPSLHCALSAYFLFFDQRHRPWRYRLFLIPIVGLWLSTIYLRYHYFIDALCGFALAAFALWLAARFPKSDGAGKPVLSVISPKTQDKAPGTK